MALKADDAYREETDDMLMSNNTPGTYILVLKLTNHADIEIGRTQSVSFEPGLYCYIGSALGPGGLKARLRRHASVGVQIHWHIDYFLSHAKLIGAIVIEDRTRHECTWASWVSRVAGSCIDGFGASDCRCKGHLFCLGESLDEGLFIKQALEALNAHYVAKKELSNLVV